MITQRQASFLQALLDERNRRRSQNSLKSFIRAAWPIIEPRRPFVDNWHLGAICEHLEAITAGQITRLVINVPFRTSKSTLVSVAWPAWVWLRDPGHQWLCGSYAEKLAIRDSLKMRRLVTHPAWRAVYGDRFSITHDQNQKVRFQNSENGYRIAFGMTGGVMGDGGDTLLIDDPHDRQGAHSEAERDTALTTYDEALVTRLNDPDKGAIVLIMQRLHANDLSGHVLKEGGWEHLMLPMRYEKERACSTSIGFKDPRTTEGELLWPERFPERAVAKLEAVLREYGTAGQLQQRPSPKGGGVLNITRFQMWGRNKPLPDFNFVLQSYDTAFTDKTQNDPTACSVWGVFKQWIDKDTSLNCIMLLEAWDDHMKYPQLKKKLIDDWQAKYGGIQNDPTHPSRRADIMLLEEKGSGISVKQDLQAANIAVIGYNPGKADKTARAQVASAVLEADVVYIPESRKEPGKFVMWARPLIEQCEQFPNAEHDDYVDTLTQAFIYFSSNDFVDLPTAPDDVVESLDYAALKRAKRNPYG